MRASTRACSLCRVRIVEKALPKSLISLSIRRSTLGRRLPSS
ncbi:unnamed protein product [Staurois parvus]|uniref:Uncharacterized protein n=1 Tax=Staurois parvus TaxID=386267 RepID=A0ABN9FK75_9NEOB|nr:unnamed protein product [Staurois parvus]